MKTISLTLALAWLGVNALTAQIDQSKTGPAAATDAALRYEEVARDAHSRVWARVSFETNVLGEVTTRTNTFVELQTGLHYREGDKWLASEAKIEILPNNAGAVASRGQHKVIFPLEIKSGLIELALPGSELARAETQWLRSRVWGLAYFDSATGESVLLAEVKASEGQLVGENTVLYPDAFTDCLADVRYDYTLASFSQDVVIRQQLPPPEKFGLNQKSTRLQVLTEFVETPTPTLEGRQAGALADQSLGFGQMTIGSGKAFSVDAEGDTTGTVTVAKEWAPLGAGGRDFLIEEVPYEAVGDQLLKLPPAGEYRGASLQRRGQGENAIAGLKSRLPPRYAKAAPKAGTKRMAQVAPNAVPGFVMDYILLTSQTNYTFKGDSTYYVSGPVNLSGTNTGFEAGAVIKYAPTNSPKLNITSPITWQGSAYRPVVMTGRNDNTVGETIPGSTGNPNTNYFANPALYIDGTAAGTNAILQNLRIAYAQSAIVFNGRTGHVVSHAQLVNCANGITATNAEFSLRNALLYNVLTNFNGSSATGRCEHLTVNTASWLNKSSAITLTMTNSLLVSVTNAGTFTSNSVSAVTSSAFQTVGAASHYLADDTYRNTGTTNINAALAKDLKQLTTYGPVGSITGALATPIILLPQVPRDTDLPDRGYHYAPLDYLCSQVSLTATAVTLSNGVAVGLYGSYGFRLLENCSVISQGRPEAMNRLAWYPAVQEQPVKINNLSGLGGFFDVNSATSTYTAYSKPILKLSFTDCVGLGRRQPFFNPAAYYYALNTVTLTDDWLRGVDFTVAGYNWTVTGFPVPVVTLQNNLVERSTVNLFNGYFGTYQNPLAVKLYNNLLWNTTLTLTYNDYYATTHPAWAVKDNLFDIATISMTGSGYSSYVSRSNNRFKSTPTGTQLESSPVNLTALTYATGWFGAWYISASTPTLVDQGSRNATNAGLYHHTLTINQVKETNSLVDVGFHYVAANTNGVPLDTDGDGLADYFEDRNGNGAYDADDLVDWQNEDTDGDGMSDGWEWNHFGSFSRDGTGDYDSDGVTDLDEYTASFDPNTILFDLIFTNLRVNANTASGNCIVLKGVPDKMAVLLDSTNFAAAAWLPYNSNLTVSVGSTEGGHQVWIGLKGRAETSAPSWSYWSLTRDTVAPVIVITNPVGTTTSQPILQLQGYSPEPLLSLRYDLTNAAGSLTNAEGYVTQQWFDTNTFRLSTNWFECVDIGLTNGTNRVTLRATDLAGNVATNVYTYLLSYAGDTNAPVLTLYWPQNGTQISGDSFTLRGKLDDATASVTAQIVDASNATNLASGLLERDGFLWVADLPLGAGTNTLTLTLTDAAGNMRATNFSVVKSTVLLTIDDLSGVDVNQPKITVTGTINVSDHTVWVNGVKATLNGDGTWTAVDVPVNEGGTAVVQARAIPNSDNGGNGSGGSGGNSANMENPGNPTSPNGKTVEGAPDKKPEIVVTHYHKNWEFAAVRLLGTPVTDHDTINIQWNLNQPGYWTWDTCYGDAADDDYYYVWTDGYWGANGIGNQTGNFDRGTQGEVCGVKIPNEPAPYTPPGWPGEYCQDGAGRVTDDPYLAELQVVERDAQTLYVLHTGGKKGTGRKNLFVLSAFAVGHADLFFPEIDYYPDTYPIAPTSVELGDLGKLGSDGVLYTALSDGVTRNVTPKVAGSRYYCFDQPGMSKHKLHITANGQDCESLSFFFRPTFIVGQYVTFGTHWETSQPYSGVPPGIVDYLTSSKWSLGGKYYNDGTNTVPGVSFPTCSINYFVNASMLADDPTTAWWVSGGYPVPRSYGVNLDKGLTFANGQHVVVNGSGTFQMYRPDATITPWPTQVSVYEKSSGWDLICLDILVAQYHGITFSNSITIPDGFSGTRRWVQIDTAPFRSLKDANSTDHTFTQNGPPPYSDPVDYPDFDGSNPVDSPGMPLPANCVRGEASDSFRMWMMFEPPGGAWVPLRAVSWSWSGTATNGPSGWGLKSDPHSIIVGATEDVESYPLWKSPVQDGGWVPQLP